MRGFAGPGEAVGDRLRVGGRRAQHAKAVERSPWRQRLRRLSRGPGRRRRRGARLGDDSPEHLDEQAGDRKVRPRRIGGDVKQHDQPLAAALGGHQRRSIGEPRPCLGGQPRFRLGQHLPRHRHLVGRSEADERARIFERRNMLRRLPGQRAAQCPAAAPQRRRYQIVVAGGEPGAREAHQDAAGIDEFRELVARRAGRHAHVGEHERRGLLAEQRKNGIARFPARFADVGVWRQGAPDIVIRRQQRLRDVGAGARDDRNAPSAPALVDQPGRARRGLVCDDEARDFVAQLHRQLETRISGQARAELKRRLSDHAALRVERPRHALGASVRVRAGEPGLQRPGKALDAGDGDRRRPLGRDGDRMALGKGLQFRREAGRAAEFEAIGDPQDFGVGIVGEETRDRRERGLARRRVGNRRQRAQFRFEIRRVERHDVQAAL